VELRGYDRHGDADDVHVEPIEYGGEAERGCDESEAQGGEVGCILRSWRLLEWG
jgi:hypothetical protein